MICSVIYFFAIAHGPILSVRGHEQEYKALAQCQEFAAEVVFEMRQEHQEIEDLTGICECAKVPPAGKSPKPSAKPSHKPGRAAEARNEQQPKRPAP